MASVASPILFSGGGRDPPARVRVLTGVDIRDAFVYPAGADRRRAAATARGLGARPLCCLWWISSAIWTTPIYVLDGPDKRIAAGELAVVLLWTAVCEYPVKATGMGGGTDPLPRQGGGDRRDPGQDPGPAGRHRQVSVAVVGARELRSYTRALSFVAGLVPLLRPVPTCSAKGLHRHLAVKALV